MTRYHLMLFLSCYFYVFSSTDILAGSFGRAVVPSVIINPGEVLTESILKELDVTNSNLRGNYAHSIKDVIGLITSRTLLPDHVIPISALHRPHIITRGSKVSLILIQGKMKISALGIALADASIGDVLSVKNSDTDVIIYGKVIDSGTVIIEIK